MDFEIDKAVPLLKSTPGVLNAMLRDLGDEWVHCNYGPDTFTPFDVVGHLVHGERDDWIQRLKIVLAHGEDRAFTPFDRYAMYQDSEGKSIHELLATFDELRHQNLGELVALNLTPEDLRKTGTHPELGRVTLENLLATWVAHDQNHIHQIAKCIAYQYRKSIGPWAEYLTFMNR